jgi:hypothetical protein
MEMPEDPGPRFVGEIEPQPGQFHLAAIILRPGIKAGRGDVLRDAGLHLGRTLNSNADPRGAGMSDNQFRVLLVEQGGGVLPVSPQDVVGKVAQPIVLLRAVHMQRSAEESHFGRAELRYGRTGLVDQVKFVFPGPPLAGQQGAAQPLVIFVVTVNHMQRDREAESLLASLGQEILVESKVAHLNRGGNPEIGLCLPQTLGQFLVLAMNVADNQDTHTPKQERAVETTKYTKFTKENRSLAGRRNKTTLVSVQSPANGWSSAPRPRVSPLLFV